MPEVSPVFYISILHCRISEVDYNSNMATKRSPLSNQPNSKHQKTIVIALIIAFKKTNNNGTIKLMMKSISFLIIACFYLTAHQPAKRARQTRSSIHSIPLSFNRLFSLELLAAQGLTLK